MCAVLTFWCRQQGATDAQRVLLTLLVGVAFACAAVASHRVQLSADTFWVLGSLALMGSLVAWGRRCPWWLTIPLLVAAALVHGVHAAAVLVDAGSTRSADVLAMLVLLALVPFACYATDDRPAAAAVLTPARAAGLTALGLALAYRLFEYWEWLAGPLAAEAAMGLIRIPLLAGILVCCCLLAFPREPRFEGGAPRGLAWPRWAVLLGLAVFLIPHGTVRLGNPFFTPHPPSAAAAQRILGTVLSDTYHAFNLPDEGDAFDALATSISQELIADVYLDSRRRLTAGTRKGAVVTIKDVGVIFVGDALPGRAEDDSFTYPCQWYVAARVTHWQHTHDRRNTYAGELTIRVEDQRWKIARLDLESEEREVLSWQSL
jgi:hydrogenase/urease accessory protein HupE